MIRALEATAHNIEKAVSAGRSAAHSGVAYSEGPRLFSSYEAPLLLAWSEGHNSARVQSKMQKESE